MIGSQARYEWRVHPIEWALFLLVAVASLHSGWLVNSADPHEFMRHGSDALGYYHWLPAVIINHEVDDMFWTYHMDNGRHLSLFSFGVAILQLPFFLMGHGWALGFDYVPDGFSSPYAVAMQLCAAFYAGAGCVLAFRLAKRFAGAESALLAAVSLFAATNLFYYAVYEPMMSHVYSFFLVGLFAYCTLRLLDGPARPAHPVHAAFFLLSASVIVLVRQLNVIELLFAAGAALGSPGGIKGLFRALFAHRRTVIVCALLALVPWALQMLYWYHIVGEPVVFTYGKKGESFDIVRMVPGLVMASVRNGWFVYTPLALPLCAWLLVHAWRGTAPARSILLVLVLVWLSYSAWWCWWLGTSYGHRGFVDLYALLAIPLAWMFHSLLRRAWSVRLSSALVMLALIKLNFGLVERFNWQWSWHEWTWQRFFAEVSAVVTG